MQIVKPKTSIDLKQIATTQFASRYSKLCLSYLEFLSPTRLQLETGRLVQVLSQHPFGLPRDDLLQLFYEDYARSSREKRACLKSRLEKTIQRCRIQFDKYGITVTYCRKTKKYLMQLLSQMA